MATLTSPGVSVTITDESQYGTAGAGTIPLIVIATASNKIISGTTSTVATGTTTANAGKLWLITSQRDIIQTFGTPTYYSSSGSQQYDNQLNEHGLFAAYEYLGIANQAYVIRANIDLSQLIPTTIQPTGPVTTGQNWLDLTNTSWGIYRSNGNINPGFAWQAKTPLVIASTTYLQKIVQGYTSTPITNASTVLMSANGTLSINSVSISLTTGTGGDSLISIVNKINNNTSLNILGIYATIFTRYGKPVTSVNQTSDIYNIRLTTTNTSQTISIDSASTSSVLTDLGLTSGQANTILPLDSYGTVGDIAINTLANASGVYKNEVWEKISLTTASAVTSWWFKVGGTETNYPGWSWTAASPVVITGTVANPTFTAADQCTVTVGSTTATITLSTTTLTGFVSDLNTQFAAQSMNVAASVYTTGSNSYLKITNYAGTTITLNDLSDQFNTTGHPLRTAGMLTTNTYWASTTGTVSNPTYTPATLYVNTATVTTAGTGYAVGDVSQDNAGSGTATTRAQFTVASITAVSAVISAVGTGYALGDTITFSGAGYTTSVILAVTAIGVGGTITTVSVTQGGQYTGATPTNPVSPTSTSGSGTTASFTITWGANTVTITTPGNYTVFPTNPISLTDISGTGAGMTLTLVSQYLTSNAFTINAGSGPVLIHIPAVSTSVASLSDVVTAINTAFSSGPIVASSSSGYLKLTNTNGTSFIVEDINGTPLNSSGIAAGVTYGRQLVYYGYSSTLTVPSTLQYLAANNIWINTTSGYQGSNYVVKQYSGTSWTTLNSNPNTGTVPMYSSDAAANTGFGSLKANGSVYIRYNNDGYSQPEASQVIYTWSTSSNAWVALSYTPSASAPTGTPTDGTYWYNPSIRADIMVNNGTAWVGYRVMYPATDPNGVIISSSQPTTQSTSSSLVDYDLWLNTAATTYPSIYRYNSISSTWTLVSNSDHQSSAGIVFSDARNNKDGTYGASELSKDMVLSAYVDADAPNPLLYPTGMMLFNTRYSTYNVKVFRKNYLSTGTYKDRWVTASGNKPDGTPYMGKYAQRIMVVNALQAVLAASQDARAEQNYFNLLATPGYPECMDEMITLNTDKKDVAFIIGDTPAHLDASGTSITAWTTNSANTFDNGDSGLISHSPYMAVYYPWGLGTNLNGTSIFVPPSSIALRTYAYNDQVAYPWFAPAGFTRGLVTGVSSVGYLDSSDSYVPVTLNEGQRNVLYSNNINPIAYIPGRGLVIYGQKTLNPTSTALDRVNVARLICELNYQLDILARPFLFEPNDNQTRSNVLTTFKSFMARYMSLRALYDYAVVCDSSNNTSDRIDRNELWIDIAIKPEKAIEFIYIPVRILNTGDPMSGGQQG